MNILILNGSPRARGETAGMIEVFQQAAEARGHSVRRFDVCRMNVKGCLACEYCHGKGQGVCVQKDDMQQISEELQSTELLVLAAPIYYHGISGQLKCVIDRFYATLYPKAPEGLRGPGDVRRRQVLLRRRLPGLPAPGGLRRLHQPRPGGPAEAPGHGGSTVAHTRPTNGSITKQKGETHMIKIYGMPTCPYCDYVHAQIAGREDEFQYINIGENIRNMSAFTRLRDTSPVFDHCKEIGDVGIPAFVFEDGRISIDQEDAGLIEYGTPNACSIEDHKAGRKGC